MWSYLIIAVLLLNTFNPSVTLPQGAPVSVCNTMLPFHGGGIEPTITASPFAVVTPVSAVGQGQILNIEIQSSPAQLTFGGLMIHARSTSPPYQVVGRFAPSSEGLINLINCGGEENTATHSSPSPKSGLGLAWQAPSDFLGEVVFNATVAQEYSKFWVGLESSPVQIVQSGTIIGTTAGISTTRQPATTPIFQQESAAIPEQGDPIYDGCGSSKSCFGFPDGCVASKSCVAIGTIFVRGDIYQFEMQSGQPSAAYVAIGLSMDARMGDDSVIECVPEGGTVRAHTSWTTGSPNYGVSRDQVPQNIIEQLEGSLVDGIIYCKVQRNVLSTVRGYEYDLVNNRYHVLVASGSSVDANSVGYHDIGRWVSGESQMLADVADFMGKSNLLLRLHAGFMLVAWIGTASVGILMARYFKQTWVGSSLCGKDQWFAWHRTFMVLTWSLTVAGFVIIFVEIGGWSGEQNPHAILGTVTTILCFIQPFGALFRPSPTHKNRPIFNWLHWLVGNLAHILAIVTIFFAVQLTKAELPAWVDWILVAFVAFHVFMHIVLSIAGCISDRSHTQRVNTFPMSEISPSRNNMKETKLDSPHGGLRKTILAIYLVIVILFVASLVVISSLAPIEQSVSELRKKLTN